MPGTDPNAPRDRPPDEKTREDAAITRTAARLFLRLQDTPDDPDLMRERDDFLAKGEAERRAYARVSRASNAARRGETARKGRLYGIALAAGVLLMVYSFNAERLRIAVMADIVTREDQIMVALASGDTVALDATSALAEDTGPSQRHITLLSGAAFFDVQKDGRSFVVDAGPLEAEALGTRYEVSRMGDAVRVTVEEGRVEVRATHNTWSLRAGEQLNWRDGVETRVVPVAQENIADWREDRLDLTSITFGEAVAVIDRRLAGRIFVPNAQLADVTLSGGLDLADPQRALEALVVAQNARLIFSTGAATLILP